MTLTRTQALARALKVGRYDEGMCARFVREQYGIAPAGDADRDGDVDAVDSWVRAKLRHPGDRNPPLGVPVFWSGGRNDHGHVAISDGRGGVVGTDAPVRGRIGTVPLAWVSQNWGLTYLGWTEDLNGSPIPLDAPPPAPKKRRPAQVRAALKAIADRLKVAGPVERARLLAARAKLRKINKR